MAYDGDCRLIIKRTCLTLLTLSEDEECLFKPYCDFWCKGVSVIDLIRYGGIRLTLKLGLPAMRRIMHYENYSSRVRLNATGNVNFAFKHLGAVLQLVLTAKDGEINVKRIDITADQNLSGEFTVQVERQ